MLRGRRVRKRRRFVWNRCAVAERPEPLAAFDAQGGVDADSASLVEGKSQLCEERVRADAGRPDERVRGDTLAAGEDDGARPGGLERRRHADLHAALRQLSRRVLAQVRRDLGEDLRRRVDEDPALPVTRKLRVVAKGVAGEVGELGQRFDPCVARTDEDEGEMRLGAAPIRLRRSRLQPAEHVIAKVDRVREVLEAQAVLGEAGDRQRTGDRAECEHSSLEADLEVPGIRLDDR